MVHLRSARYFTAAVVLTASLTVSGCGGSSKPAICSDVDSLKSSITDLRDVKLEAGALATLQSDLTKVQSDLSKVKSEAKTQYAAEISSVEQAAASLEHEPQGRVRHPVGRVPGSCRHRRQCARGRTLGPSGRRQQHLLARSSWRQPRCNLPGDRYCVPAGASERARCRSWVR